MSKLCSQHNCFGDDNWQNLSKFKMCLLFDPPNPPLEIHIQRYVYKSFVFYSIIYDSKHLEII